MYIITCIYTTFYHRWVQVVEFSFTASFSLWWGCSSVTGFGSNSSCWGCSERKECGDHMFHPKPSGSGILRSLKVATTQFGVFNWNQFFLLPINNCMIRPVHSFSGNSLILSSSFLICFQTLSLNIFSMSGCSNRSVRLSRFAMRSLLSVSLFVFICHYLSI